MTSTRAHSGDQTGSCRINGAGEDRAAERRIATPQVAETLGISLGSVKAYASRGVASLRVAMESPS
jgi:hypothetical protein